MGFGGKEGEGPAHFELMVSSVLSPVSLLAFSHEWKETSLKRPKYPHRISCFGRLLFTYNYLRNLQEVDL